MDIELTSEQQMLTESIKAFVTEELIPLEVTVERAGEVSAAQGDKIKQKALDMGFYAANLPESVGGDPSSQRCDIPASTMTRKIVWFSPFVRSLIIRCAISGVEPGSSSPSKRQSDSWHHLD